MHLVQTMAAIATIREFRSQPLTLHLRKVAGTILRTKKAAHALNREIGKKEGKPKHAIKNVETEIDKLPLY